jgi:hypothetical protein
MTTPLRLLAVALLLVIPASAGSPVAAHSATQAAAQSPGAASFAQGVKLHDSGKPADAIPLFKQAIAEGYQPINQARFRLARSLARAGQADAALTELEAIAAAGFANLAVMSNTDLDSLRPSPRFQAFEKRVNANARPCAADPRFRQFDFWIGEWDVQPTGSTRTPLGTGATSIIEKQLEGCVIQENWLPPGGTAGKSFNIFNRVTSQWEQYWVDQTGRVTHYFGTFKDDGNLYFEAEQFGGKSKVRMTFFNQGPNQVRQLGHLSTDGGKTWSVSFDLTYVRKK